jgi:hypothetical protein
MAATGTGAAQIAPAIVAAGIRVVAEPLVSLLLYLCSHAAVIGDGNRHSGTRS